MKLKLSILLIALFTPLVALATDANGHPDMGVIVRLAPTVFKELPGKIVKELQALKCTVPQMGGIPMNKQSRSVISGSFAAKGQTDWAVLCSIDGVSSIRIFWGGAAKCPSEIAVGPDREQMSGIDGYSRAIFDISEEDMLDAQYESREGEVKLPPIPHYGIWLYISDNKGQGYYCSNRVWLHIQPRSPFEQELPAPQ